MLALVQIGGLLGGPMSFRSPVTWLVWLPVLIFELTFAYWLLRWPASLASLGNAH